MIFFLIFFFSWPHKSHFDSRHFCFTLSEQTTCFRIYYCLSMGTLDNYRASTRWMHYRHSIRDLNFDLYSLKCLGWFSKIKSRGNQVQHSYIRPTWDLMHFNIHRLMQLFVDFHKNQCKYEIYTFESGS